MSEDIKEKAYDEARECRYRMELTMPRRQILFHDLEGLTREIHLIEDELNVCIQVQTISPEDNAKLNIGPERVATLLMIQMVAPRSSDGVLIFTRPIGRIIDRASEEAQSLAEN